MNRRVPRFARFDHGVQDSQQLAHAGYEGDLFWFACSNQAIVEDLDHWVVTRGDQRGHVEHMSHAASTKDGTPTSHDAGIAIEWRHADERADLAARQPAQLRHLGN